MQNRLKELRTSLGLNQTEFAGKIHIAQTTYSHLENGTRTVKDIHIAQIVSAFGVSEQWLRTGEGPMFSASSGDVDSLVSRYSFPEIVAEFLRAYDALSPAQQYAVLSYAREVIRGLTAPASQREAGARAYIEESVEKSSHSPPGGNAAG